MDLHKTMAFVGGKRVCAGAFQATSISCTVIGRLDVIGRLQATQAHCNILAIRSRTASSSMALLTSQIAKTFNLLFETLSSSGLGISSIFFFNDNEGLSK
ncbi:unnamed protein product [Ilex paraguariensis]|uniref:Uncharacterized protein n=1 Tax=Ilex paraguariensis TaxID=185542 RepID=A0ABC8V564_9AQUA